MRDLSSDVEAKGQNMNRRALAKEIGISPITLIRITKRDLVPDMKTLEKICRWLGRSPNEYYGISQIQVTTPKLSVKQIGLSEAILKANQEWIAGDIVSIGHN